MHTSDFIVREPLLDPKQQVLGYELSWQQSGSDKGLPGASNPVALAGLIGQHLNNGESGWLLGGALLFLQASPELLATDALLALPPKNTVLALTAADLADPAVLRQSRNCAHKAMASCCAMPISRRLTRVCWHC